MGLYMYKYIYIDGNPSNNIYLNILKHHMYKLLNLINFYLLLYTKSWKNRYNSWTNVTIHVGNIEKSIRM